MENQAPNEPINNNPLLRIEHNSEIGPLEFNLLERIEKGLDVSENEPDFDSKASHITEKDDSRYEEKRQVISVSGWASINSIYDKYIWEFIFKLVIGSAILGILLSENKYLWQLSFLFLLYSVANVVKSAIFLKSNWDNNFHIKMIHWIDLNQSVSYLIYFVGLVLFFMNRISGRILPVFSFPIVSFSLFSLFQTSDDNLYLGQKRFIIFEAVQLFMISLKIGHLIQVNLGYLLFYFMAASIYLCVIGFFLLTIISCSFTGIVYANLRKWKFRSLIWITWYYFTSGLVYIYFLKSLIRYYKDDVRGDTPEPIDYAKYVNVNCDDLILASIFIIINSGVCLILILVWKNEVKRFFAKIIYKNEIRKEITLRFLTKSFTFKLIQISATYFSKPKTEEEDRDIEIKDNNNKSQIKNESFRQDCEPCPFCCEKDPEVMVEPCGHGGICKECLLRYLKTSPTEKCPFCKQSIDKILLIEWQSDKKEYHAKGEILFKK